jgi:RNA polymerase sigma factor (sigma-70 family)
MSEAAAELPTNLISVERWSIDHSHWLRGIVGQYEQPLLTFATRILGDPELARDVVQDTFVRLGESGPWQFVSGDPAKWLFKVCRNRAVDVCRRTRRLSFVDQTELEDEPSHDESPAEAVARRDDASNVMRLVADLSRRQQEVIQLRFQSDLSYREIAEILGTTESNVGVTLHAALKSLRERRAQFQP